MPNKKISQLPVITSLTGTETIPALKDSIVKKTTTGVVTNRMKELARYSNYSAIQDIKESAKETLFEGLSAGSVLQQDITAVSSALHRSPNAVTAMFVYDTSKDSDGGAWTEKCQHTSWYNEPLSGKWLGAQTTEANARAYNATLGSELITNGDFSNGITGWSSEGTAGTVVNGQYLHSGVSGNNLYRNIAVTPGKSYSVSWNITLISGSACLIYVYDSSGFTNAIFSASGSNNRIIIPTSNTIRIYLYSTGGSGYYDNISVKEVLSTSTQTNDYFQLTTDGKFYALSKNLLTTTNTLATQTQWLTAGTYTMSSTTASTGSVAISGAATATHTAGGNATTFTVATSGSVTFTVTGSVTNAQLEVGSVATVYKANTSTNRYTEVFRGNKAEFPKLAGIVAEAGNLTIYDLTESGRPMWMRFVLGGGAYNQFFIGSNITSIGCINGSMWVGLNDGAYYRGHLMEAKFISDKMLKRHSVYNQTAISYYGLSYRNSSLAGFAYAGPSTNAMIINQTGVPDARTLAISLTILPDAPIESTTGLQIPTVAVGTFAGLGLIKHDGTVVNSALTSAFNKVTITPKALIASSSASNTFYYALNPGKLSSGFTLLTDTSASAPDFNLDVGSSNLIQSTRSTYIRSASSSAALQILKHNENTLAKSMTATITPTYNTGYQIGDIRRTYLSDTISGVIGTAFNPQSMFTTGINGVWYDPSDINRYMSSLGPELVTNGDFSNGTTGWTNSSTGSGTFTVSNGAAIIVGTDGSNRGAFSQNINAIAGKWYKVSFTATITSGTGSFFGSGTGSSGSAILNGINSFYIAAVVSGAFFVYTNSGGGNITIDNISITELTSISTATLFQDAAATTPVTSVEQPVGLILDKSKGLVPSSELVTNGDFSNGTTGWTITAPTIWSITGGQAVCTSGGSTLKQTSILSVGKLYQISFDILNYTSGSLLLTSFSGSTAISGNGTKTFIRYATSTDFLLYANTNTNLSVDNISVKELPGNHAFNSSGNSANFPILSARYNLLTGTGTVINRTLTITSDYYYTLATTAISSGIQVTGRCVLSGSGTITLSLLTGAGNDLSPIVVNLTNTPTAYSITAINPTSGPNCGILIRGVGTTATVTFTDADLRVSNDALNQPAYQRVNSATDYDTVGFKPYLSFNGVNQWLQTNSIDFSYTDKMFLSAGVRKLSDAATSILAELSSNLNSNNGTFYITAPFATSTNDFRFASKGTASSACTAPGYPAPVTSVIGAYGDISNALSVIRINGVQTGANALSQGTGNYGNYPLYIGARGGTSLFFNGRLYGLIVVGKQVNEAELINSELWVSNSTALQIYNLPNRSYKSGSAMVVGSLTKNTAI